MSHKKDSCTQWISIYHIDALQGARLRISRFRVKLIFFCPRFFPGRKAEFRSLAPHGHPRTVRAPRETREVPRRPRQVAEGPRGTCLGSRRVDGVRCGLASRDARSSPPSNHHNHFVFFVSVDAAAAPEEPPRRRSCIRPIPLRKHATLTNHNDNICTPVYASNVNTFPISTAHAAASATATNPPVASRSLGVGAWPPQPADCIARAARDMFTYGARRWRAALV